MNLGVKLEEVREEVLNLSAPGSNPMKSRTWRMNRASPRPLLHDAARARPARQLRRDLTELVKNGELDPVIGRSEEIERLVQILCRRTKNNPVLLGEAGVGKQPSSKDWPSRSSPRRS